MKSTSPLAVNGTPENQRTAAIGADESVRPKSWSYMHRAKWARSLPVKSGARLTAIAISDHINEKTGWWDLSAAQMADETGQGERTVRRHVNEDLRAYFHIEDRPGRMWRFTIPAPMMAVVEPRPNRPHPPAKLADVPSDLPSNVHTQGGRERLTCEKHSRFLAVVLGERAAMNALKSAARPERAAEPPERPCGHAGGSRTAGSGRASSCRAASGTTGRAGGIVGECITSRVEKLPARAAVSAATGRRA